MKKGLIFLIFLLIAVAGFFIFGKNNFSSENSESHIQINGKKIKVGVSKTETEREAGLSRRENLCGECGMLFIFEQAKNYPFWMKEMRFNLDMLWISGNRVVKIVKNIPHEKGTGEVVNPQVLADKVLEINAGKSDEWGIREGDEIVLNLQ